MIRALYTFLLVIALPFLLPSLYKHKLGKPSVGTRWKEHFGLTPSLNNPENKPVIWVHAVSVGEVIAASPLIKKIHQAQPNAKILVTTTTPTGAKQAENLKEYAEHRYMPLDFTFAVKAFLKVVRPKQLIIVETELWPNTLITVSKKHIPITVVNARLSDKSFRGYSKVKPLFNLLSPSLSKVICQHKDDARRFENLGVPQSKIFVSGSIKFDISISSEQSIKGKQLRCELDSFRPIWIAASTHQGEDEKILAAHSQVLQHVPNALLILVPRHPERFNDVMVKCSELFTTVRRTGNSTVSSSTQVYLGDTMGEMLTLIGASDVCFMGGSLLGNKVGGHNLLEPAALAKPTLTGPSYFNFSDITKQLVASNSCQIINSESELAEKIIELFHSTDLRDEQGQAALSVVERNRGALKNTIQHIFGEAR
ncbi:3-deoxy-D-manno-octulosonic acid transferase [Vibrio coralliilyticus]|uniref:lipid IV(A) 3-deoxy-D-manno-octulosonic acid transferase n=1 Tax=Vibrio coralliilyticus TaxID=190893 RepID=UPI000810ABC2|nr:lipid IV(A) 3-deoxy-D-manno-octulosonic acid transferase [Vibrio coralliilyticus]ANW24215.1 3-deoxy-D-manno-octulosonic acid transferase [Vibrio coralliilyticus]